MDRARGYGWVVVFLALLPSCRGGDSLPAVVSGDGAEIVVPGGIDASGLTIASAGRRLHDPALASIGRGWIAKPGGVTFDKPVVLRVPVAEADMAGYLAKPQDLSIYTRGDGEGRFHRLATRLSADGKMLEADVKHFSLFQVGFGLNDICLFEARPTDCTVKVCSLAALIESQDTMTGPASPDDTDNPRTIAADMARTACAQAQDGEYPAAISTLGQLETYLVQELATEGVTPGTYGFLTDAIREAELMLLRVPSVDISGTWLASIPINGELRSITLELLQRRDGTVMGMVLGGAGMGTLGRTVKSGGVVADQLQLVIEDSFADGEPVTYSVEGTVTPATDDEGLPYLRGTATDPDGNPFTIVWHMTAEKLTERRFMVFDRANDTWTLLTVVVNAPGDGSLGGLVSGAFSSDCFNGACYGEVYALAEDPDGHVSALMETHGGIQLSTNMAYGSNDPASSQYPVLYGTYNVVNNGSQIANGFLVGFEATGTNTAHAAAALRTYGRLADDIERHADFMGYLGAGSYPPISAGYMHDGTNAGDLLASLAAETHAFDLLKVELSGFRGLATITPTRTLALGVVPTGVDFDDHREGTRGTAAAVVYYDKDGLPPFDQLRHLVVEDDGIAEPSVQLQGNRLLARDLELPLSDEDLDSNEISIAVSPYGVHEHGLCQECSDDRPGEQRVEILVDADTAPTLHAPADLDIVFAPSGTDWMCRDNAVVDFTLSQTLLRDLATPGAYGLAMGPITCGWTGTPEPFHAGDSMGAMQPEAGDPGHFKVNLQSAMGFPGSFCPFYRMSDHARGLTLKHLNSSPYKEQLTEPFVCNDPFAAFPLKLRWTLEWTTQASGNPVPEAIEFTRASRNADPIYQYEFIFENEDDNRTGDVLSMEEADAPDGAPYWILHLDGGDLMAARVHAAPDGALLFVNLASQHFGNGFTVYSVGTIDDYCDDDNPCTDDWMQSPGLCTHEPNESPCFAGNRCFIDDRCSEGRCVHWPDEDTALRRECPEGFECIPAVGCAVLPGDLCEGPPPVECPEPDQCHDAGTCNPATGHCSNPAKQDGTACDDGNACSTVDTCQSGVCTGSVPPECDDDNPCTDDSCNDVLGCVHANNTIACDDSDPCTVDDACRDGTCSGEQKGCDDGNVCTADSCGLDGECAHADVPGSCDDGLPFTEGDQCEGDEGALECHGVVVQDCADSITFGTVFAVSDVRLGSTGMPGQGLDLDGDAATCAPMDFLIPCGSGIDNQAALVEYAVRPVLAQELETVTWGTVLMDFKNHVPGGGAFTLPLYAGKVDPANAGCRFIEESCGFLVPYYNFDSSCEPLYRFTNAVVTPGTGGHGTLTAGGPGTDVVLVVPYNDHVFRGTVYSAQVKANVTLDGSGHITGVTSGSIVAGAVRPDDLWNAFDVMFPGDMDTVVYVHPTFGSIDKTFVYFALHGVATDFDTDNDSEPDAVSIGAVFAALEGNVSGFARSCEEASDCADGDPCTNDTCENDGACSHVQFTGPCEDGLPFTSGEECVWENDALQCAGGEVADCTNAPFGPTLEVDWVNIAGLGVGLDLDNNIATCAPPPEDQCTSGIDNQAAILVFEGGVNDILESELATVTWGTVLMDFHDFDVETQDPVLRLYAGKVDPRNPTCQFTTESCDFTVPYYNFDSGCLPLYTLGNVQMSGADEWHPHITAGSPGTTVELVVPYGGRIFRGTIYSPHVSMDLTMEEGDDDFVTATGTGIVGGAVRPGDLWNVFDFFYPGDDTIVVHESPQVLKGQVRELLANQNLLDFHTTAGGPADAISIGALFTVRHATVLGVAGDCVSANDCDDDDICTNDSCDAVVGCLHTYNTAPCANGTCQSGKCVGQ